MEARRRDLPGDRQVRPLRATPRGGAMARGHLQDMRAGTEGFQKEARDSEAEEGLGLRRVF